MEKTKTPFTNPDLDISSFKYTNFEWVYFTHMNSESRKLGGVGKVILRDVLPYVEVHLNHPEIGVMII